MSGIYKSISFRNKITFSVILISFLALIITVSIISMEYSKVIEENNYTKTQHMVEQLTNYYNEKLINIINLTHGTIQNDVFQTSVMSTLWDSKFSYAKELSVIQGLFQSIMLRERMVDSIFLYTPKDTFCDSLHTLRPTGDLENSTIYRVMDHNRNIYWGNAAEDELLRNRERILPIALHVPTSNENAKIFIVANISEKNFATEFKKVSKENNVSVYIINDNNEIVDYAQNDDYMHIFKDEELLSQLNAHGNIKYKNEDDQLYINFATIQINNWRVITVQNVKDLMKNVNQLRLYTIIFGIMAMIITGFSAYILSTTMTRPIYSLHSIIEEISHGNLSKRYNPTGKSAEIDHLGMSFNDMLDVIERLVKELEREKDNTKIESEQKIKAMISALQAQINSHFLYNTLDSIYWKSKLAKNEVVSEMIISLSNMFRISLSQGGDTITVDREVEHVRSFLYLQSNVYPEKFIYHFDVIHGLDEYYTVKLILQPLVENSITHGFENIDYLGQIKVTVGLYQDRLHYTVWDNGAGFDAEKLMDEILQFDINTRGYALKNVYRRLKLAFGEEVVFRLESQPGISNRVEIIIPMIQNLPL